MHIQNTADPQLGAASAGIAPAKHSASREVQIALLTSLLEAETFETFLHTRYVGQKRFSLQGAESLMVILDTILHDCPRAAWRRSAWAWRIAAGSMCSRISCKKSLKVIFTEFTENYMPRPGRRAMAT